MPRMTEEQIKQKLKEAFDEVDTDKDGIISHDDLKTACQKAGLRPTDGDIQVLIAACDESGNGKISFEEFATAIVETYVKYRIALELRKTFMELDVDGTGYITADNIRDVCASYGESISQEQVAELILAMDKDGSGQISLPEFVDAAVNLIEEKIKEEQAKA